MYNWIVKRLETATAIHEAVSAGTCTTPDQVAAIAAKYGDEIFWTGAMPESRKGAGDIDTTISDLLREIGISARVLGYQYVWEAIKLTVRVRFLEIWRFYALPISQRANKQPPGVRRVKLFYGIKQVKPK